MQYLVFELHLQTCVLKQKLHPYGPSLVHCNQGNEFNTNYCCNYYYIQNDTFHPKHLKAMPSAPVFTGLGVKGKKVMAHDVH
mgnify:CR=1 FL=1